VALCVAVVVLAVVSAQLFGALRAAKYGARAEILYDAPATAPLDSRERGLATQRALILSRAVLMPAATDQQQQLEKVEDAVSVDLGTRDDLLYITAAATTRSAALDLAFAVTESYLRLDATLRADAQNSRETLEEELNRLSARERTASTSEAQLLRQRIGRLEDGIMQQQTELAGRPEPRLLSSVYGLDNPVSPNRVRLAATGLVIGLMLAAVLALALLRLPGRRTL
jgi:hypothetical protein